MRLLEARALPDNVARSKHKARRRATAALLLAGVPLALAACTSGGEPQTSSPTISASASHSLRPTETPSAAPTPKETQSPKPELAGTPSQVEIRGKTLDFRLLTPVQLKTQWEDFKGQDIGLVVHPFAGTDQLNLQTYSILESGPAAHPTTEYAFGTVTFKDGDIFPVLYPYTTNQEQKDANTAATTDAYSSTGEPFAIIAKVAPIAPATLESFLGGFRVPNKVREKINKNFILIEQATPSTTKGIRHATAH